jgi:hypothetical protein
MGSLLLVLLRRYNGGYAVDMLATSEGRRGVLRYGHVE